MREPEESEEPVEARASISTTKSVCIPLADGRLLMNMFAESESSPDATLTWLKSPEKAFPEIVLPGFVYAEERVDEEPAEERAGVVVGIW